MYVVVSFILLSSSTCAAWALLRLVCITEIRVLPSPSSARAVPTGAALAAPARPTQASGMEEHYTRNMAYCCFY